MGRPLVRLSVCHSTNAWLGHEVAEKGSRLSEGYTVITHHQTQGRGQRGNTWEAEAGKNLTFSVLMRPVWLPVSKQFGLSMAVALAVHDMLSDFDTDFRIKWPNDIIWQNKQKICGILIENTVQSGRLTHSIIGIGININQQHFVDRKAVSLSKIAGQKIDKEAVLERLLSCLEARYLQLRTYYDKLKSDYLNHLLHFGQEADYKRTADGWLFSGKITDVSDHGLLLIETATGPKTFGFKEIAFSY